MNNRNAAFLVLSLGGIAGFANAETLTWVGSSGTDGAKWYTYSSANWTNSAGTAVKWTDGNEALFTDDATVKDIIIGSNVKPNTVTFDIDSDMTLTNASGSICSPNSRFSKYGTGTLWHKNGLNASQNRVDVWGGTLRASSPNLTRSIGCGDANYSYDAYVHSGGKLWIDERNALGTRALQTSGNFNKNGVHITVYTNGVFSLHNGIQCAQNIQDVGTLDLLGGTFQLPDGYQGEDTTKPWMSGDYRIGSHSSGCLRVWDRVTFGLNPGKVPYVFDMIGDGAVASARNNWILGTNTEFRVEDITESAAVDVTFNNPLIASCAWDAIVPCGFRKTGAGKMVLNHEPIHDSEVERPTGPIRVEEGVLEYTKELSFAPFVVAPIYVGTNATLIVTNKFLVDSEKTGKTDFGVLKAGNVPRPVTVDHGTLTLAGTTPAHVFGDLTLDESAIDFSSVAGDSDGFALGFLGKVSLLGKGTLVWDNAALFPNVTRGQDYALLGMDLTEFYVPTRTNDENVADFRLCIKVRDQRDKVARRWNAAGFRKTGAGMMTIETSNQQYTGDVVVNDGTLVVGPLPTDPTNWNTGTHIGGGTAHPMGPLTGASSNRLIVADGTSATIWMPNRNTFFANLKAVTNSVESIGANSYNFANLVVKNGGTLKCTQHEQLHSFTVENGGKLLGGGMNTGWGIFTVLSKFTVMGNAPFFDGGDVDLPNDGYPLSEGAANWAATKAICVNGYPQVEFDVGETGAGDDATFYRPIAINYGGKDARATWKFGFRKTGAGTMRLAARVKPSSSVYPLNGTIDVAAGELKVDCDQQELELVDVKAGAALSGTGTVSNVTLADGVTLRARQVQAKPLVVKGNLTAGANLAVDINLPADYTEADLEAIKAKILTVEGTVTGAENLANAAVTVNGEPTDKVRLIYSGKSLRAGYARGFILLFR